jgi:hypothetical protein
MNTPTHALKTLNNVLIEQAFAQFMLDRPELFERTAIPCAVRDLHELLLEDAPRPATKVRADSPFRHLQTPVFHR